MLLHWESQPHRKSQTAFWKVNRSWIIQGNLTLTSGGKTQLNFRGTLVQFAAKPPPGGDFISSKVSTLCQPQMVATKRFCSARVATSRLLDQASFFRHISFLLEWVPWCVRRGLSTGTSQGKPCACPVQHPCVLGGEPAEKSGAFPRDLGEGLSLSSKFLRVRLFLTSKFLGVTQEEEFTWELQVEEGQPAEAD